LTAVVILEGIVIALLTALVLGLLRSHAEILRALHELGVNLDGEDDGRFRLREGSGGAPEVTTESAPVPARGQDEPPPGIVEARRPVNHPAELGSATDLVGETPDGEMVAVSVAGAPQPTLLAFLSSGCVTCQDFWSAFDAGVSLELDGREVRIVAVTKGPESESPPAVAELASPVLTTVMSSEAYDAYGVPVSPYFVLVDAHNGVIVGEGAAGSWAQLASLLDRAVADRGETLGANRTRREMFNGAARTRRVDRELDAAGIGPDHPSLHQ